MKSKLLDIIKMGFQRILTQTIKRSDLLGAPTNLRKSGEPFYQSVFGGIVTIILFIIFTVIFGLKMNALVTLQNINSNGALANNQNDTASIDNFFFGVTIPYITYIEMTTYFDITLKMIYTQTGQADVEVPITLINCTKEMWSSRQIYNDFLYNGYLCPLQTNLLKIYKTTSKQAYLKLTIDCTDCSDPAYQTLSDAIQQSYDLFQADIQYINTIISQGKEKPISYYIDTIPVSTFGTDLGIRAEIQLTPYQIDTDVSFLPYSQQQKLTGFYISNAFSTKTKLYSGPYGVFKFSKSKLQYTVTRDYGKFDDLLSYVGGLFSLLFVVFAFFLGPYNQFKYEFMIAEAIFKNDSLDNVNKITEENFNFYTYLKYIVYDWLQFWGCPPKKWKQMKQFNESRQEALYLLDAKYLMKRIRYLETAVNILLPKNKQICLRLTQTPQIETIRKQRKIMELFEEYQEHKHHQKIKSLKLADILMQKTVINTIYQFAKPSDQYLQAKTVDLQKWREEVSDSQYIEDEEVKHQIQQAISQMLQKKEIDDEYNKIYDLMEHDFKGWANSDISNNYQQRFQNDQSKMMSIEKNTKVKTARDLVPNVIKFQQSKNHTLNQSSNNIFGE